MCHGDQSKYLLHPDQLDSSCPEEFPMRDLWYTEVDDGIGDIKMSGPRCNQYTIQRELQDDSLLADLILSQLYGQKPEITPDFKDAL